MKKILSILLSLTLLVMSLSGMVAMTVSASTTEPTISVNIAPYATVAPDTTITVSYAARGGYTLKACDTRLEGTSLGTAANMSFKPADCGLSDGLYTLMMKATDSSGDTAYKPLTFTVDSSLDAAYTVNGNTVSSASAVTYYTAEALEFAARYGTTPDGKLNLSSLYSYTAQETSDMRYGGSAVSATSASGLPYQVFDIKLGGKTSGNVAVSYSGSTLAGERMAVKVYRPAVGTWDTIGGFAGTGTVSELVDIATYNDGGVIHVAAVLDYANNGADTMVWSTDPQHYTKFADLNEYYYAVYKYVAAGYQNGDFGYVMTTGDLVDDRPTAAVAPKQWAVADKAMSYVEAVGMPNGVVSGNHDVADFSKPDYSAGPNTVSNYSMFAKTFPADRYNDYSWYGGSLNNNTSHYDLVTIGNIDFIFMHLGYGFEADDETVAWANDALETYRHRTAIVMTHQYLNATTAIYGPAGRGQLIYDKIVDPNPNVKVVLCGHDDGSLCIEKTASDGRKVYEILADYQFVEAEEPEFYANEHWIGAVPSCCGDGYIRLMTVEGDTLRSVTYSPVADRYNPYGDRENLTLDLNVTAVAREINTTQFSAAVLGGTTTATNVDRVAVVGSGARTAYSPVLYANASSVASRPAATPAKPLFKHSASAAPTVTYKADVLAAAGLSNGVTCSYWTPYGNSSSAPLGFNVNLEKTPYLYYSFNIPQGANFTFSFISDMTTANWLTFLDASKGGGKMSVTNPVWDSYSKNEQYLTTSETGCIDMREYLLDPDASTWKINQLTFYNESGIAVTVDYLFFGSADGKTAATGTTVADKAALQSLINEAAAITTTGYTTATVNELNSALTAARSAVSGSAASVQAAYVRLSQAVGALTPVKTSINESTLASVKNYSLNFSYWKNLSAPTWTQTYDGFIIEIPSTAASMWGAVANYDVYTVYPEQNKVFLKADVVAQSGWALQFNVTQNGKTATVHVNGGMENAFNDPGVDGMNGVFRDIYDISDAFEMNGFDPKSTFTVNYVYIYAVGTPAKVEINHIELLTKKSDGVIDGGNLMRAIERAEGHTQSLYTSASWSAMQTSLTNAKAALKNTSLKESDMNLYALNLNAAVDGLVYSGSYPETKGSLLPADSKMWKASDASVVSATRQNGVTTIKNSNSAYPYMDYVLNEPLRAMTADSRLVVDISVGANANILFLVGDTYVSINPYLSDVLTGQDLPAGTYTASIPLSEFTEWAGKGSVEISRVRVYTVGTAANSAVTLRTLRIAEYEDYAWDASANDYGVAATPSAPYYAHCAPYAPEVQYKVDLLLANGLEDQYAVSGWQAYPGNIKIDLAKTPYLYYSVQIPAGGNFTFGFHNDATNAPYYVFRDNHTAGGTLNTGVGTFEGYTGASQYITRSETACIDMRQFLTDPSSTAWTITNMSFYNTLGKKAIISYMFFGSAPTYVETDVEIKAEEPEKPVEPEVTPGDVDGNGTLTTYDAMRVLQYTLNLVEFDPTQLKAADFDGNGFINTADARDILRATL